MFSALGESAFTEQCLSAFRHQYASCKVYRDWVSSLRINIDKINSPEEIPFLPIELFKYHKVISGAEGPGTLVFSSSGTTGQQISRHFVTDAAVYEKSFSEGFKYFYGDPAEYCILALLPNYLQRQGSSLVYMCDHLIRYSKHADSGFYLDDNGKLLETISRLKSKKQKTLLIGVSYALLDLCELSPALGELFTVMETGGMKGRRKEMLKPELHSALKKGLGIKTVHSEYGMTELLSQAYSQGDGLFRTPGWMRFLIRETDDPFKLRKDGRTGGINVIDLANINSCSFIATQDLGRLHKDGSLELMGRFDNSDIRGCNLMIEF